MALYRRLCALDREVKAIRAKAEEMVAEIERSGANDRHDLSNSVCDIATGLGDVEDSIVIAKLAQQQMKRRL